MESNTGCAGACNPNGPLLAATRATPLPPSPANRPRPPLPASGELSLQPSPEPSLASNAASRRADDVLDESGGARRCEADDGNLLIAGDDVSVSVSPSGGSSAALRNDGSFNDASSEGGDSADLACQRAAYEQEMALRCAAPWHRS